MKQKCRIFCHWIVFYIVWHCFLPIFVSCSKAFTQYYLGRKQYNGLQYSPRKVNTWNKRRDLWGQTIYVNDILIQIVNWNSICWRDIDHWCDISKDYLYFNIVFPFRLFLSSHSLFPLLLSFLLFASFP